MAPPSVAPRSCSPVIDSRECRSDYPQVPLSAESRAMLEAGIRSALEQPLVDRPSYAQYADDV
jgi:hypothetical protein